MLTNNVSYNISLHFLQQEGSCVGCVGVMDGQCLRDRWVVVSLWLALSVSDMLQHCNSKKEDSSKMIQLGFRPERIPQFFFWFGMFSLNASKYGTVLPSWFSWILKAWVLHAFWDCRDFSFNFPPMNREIARTCQDQNFLETSEIYDSVNDPNREWWWCAGFRDWKNGNQKSGIQLTSWGRER